MIRRATTICGGVAIALCLLLPVEPARTARASQTVPPVTQTTPPATPVTPAPPAAPPGPATPGAPYEARWTTVIDAIDGQAAVALAVTAEHVILAGEDLPLQARALNTGQTLWSRQAITGQLAVAADRIVGTAPGTLHAVALADGRPLWSVPLAAPTTGPAVDGDLILVTAGAELRAHRADTGAVVWQQPLEAPASRRPLAAGGRVVVAIAGDRLVAFDRQTGAPAWRTQLDAAPAAPGAAAERITFTTVAGHLCAVQLLDGHLDWCFRTTPVPSAGAPLVAGELAYFALLDNTLRAFQIGGGTLARLERLPARAVSGPLDAGMFLAIPLTTSAFALFPRQPGGAMILVPATPPADQRLLAAAATADGAWLVSLAIDLSARRSLRGYGRSAPPPPPAPPK